MILSSLLVLFTNAFAQNLDCNETLKRSSFMTQNPMTYRLLSEAHKTSDEKLLRARASQIFKQVIKMTTQKSERRFPNQLKVFGLFQKSETEVLGEALTPAEKVALYKEILWAVVKIGNRELKSVFLDHITQSTIKKLASEYALPTKRDLARLINLPIKDVPKLFGFENWTPKFFDYLNSQIEEREKEKLVKLRQKFMTLYKARAVKYRRTLSFDQFLIAVLQKSDVQRRELEASLKRLFGDAAQEREKGEWVFPVFSSFEALGQAVQEKYPDSMVKVHDMALYGPASNEKIIEAWMNHPRLLLTSAASGVRVNDEVLDSLKTLMKELNAPLVIYPEAGIINDLDPRLLSLPNAFLITEDIEFSPWLQLNALPLPFKRTDSLSNLRQPGRGGERGQTQIVGHPQVRDEILPTGVNKWSPHRLLTTGAISEPWYNARYVIGGVTDQQARDVHRIAVVVIEKDSDGSGIDGLGTPNSTHVRHIDMAPAAVDPLTGDRFPAGFVDANRLYTVNGVVQDLERSLVLTPGDDHIMKHHLGFASVRREILQEFRPRYYVSHDIFEGLSVTHHEWGDPLKMAKKAKRGELDVEEELSRIVEFVNALQKQIPDLHVVIPDANHNAWLIRAIKDPNIGALPHYGTFFAELRNAYLNMNIPPLEYVFFHRAKHIRSNPRLENSFEGHLPEVFDPTRLTLLRLGESFPLGGPDSLVEYGEHGHKGGGYGSRFGITLRTTAGRSYTRIVKGHSHSPGRFNDAVDAGGSVPVDPEYAAGGPSGVGIAFVTQARNSSLQLFHYNSASETYRLKGNPAPPDHYRFQVQDGLSYPRVDHKPDRTMNLDTLDQWRHGGNR